MKNSQMHKNNNLLESCLQFDPTPIQEEENNGDIPEQNVNIIKMMRLGKINQLNQVIQPLQFEGRFCEIENIINRREEESLRTGLFYAVYHDY